MGAKKKYLCVCIVDGSLFWDEREDETYCPHCRSLRETQVDIQPGEPRLNDLTIRSFASQADTSWQPGQAILGRFEVVRQIAETGTSRVYQVRPYRSSVEMAMKVPQSYLLQNGEALRQYAREAEILFNLQEAPHVLKIDQARCWRGIPLLFTELAEGGDLSLVIQNGDLYRGDPGQVLGRILDLAIQSAQALVGVHARGIIHANIKPGCFLLNREGQLRLGGFEMAQRLPKGKESMGIQGYTPAYCSPEQAEGVPLTRQTDTWSWALSVLEIFNGGLTWISGVQAIQVLDHYLENGPAECIEGGVTAMPIMPDGLPAMLRQCFQADPAARPENMNQVIEPLQRIYRRVTGKAHQLDRMDPYVLRYAIRLNLEDGLNRGITLFEYGQYDRSVEQFEFAVESFPDNGWAWLNLGFAHLCLRPHAPGPALECFQHLPSYQDPGYSIGQVDEHFMSIWDIRLDMQRRLVWIAGDTGITMVGAPGYAPYDFHGLNLSPELLPEFADRSGWGCYQDSERYPWTLGVGNADILETRLDETIIMAPSTGYHCRACRAVVSGEANRDGRAEELRGTVDHLCRSCAAGQRVPDGKTIGDYWLLKRLGTGWMGAVHEAWHEPTRRVLHLGFLPEHFPDSAKRRAAYIMNIWRQLDHPNLARLIGVEDTPQGRIWLLDSNPGISLENMLEERAGALPYGLATALLLQVLDGLAYLHGKGYVHRNISPRNTYIKQVGSQALVRLSGFDFLTDTQNADDSPDREGEVAGTPPFMPVEQITNFKYCVPPVDIYAAGVMLYYMLSGCYSLPFPSRADIAKGARLLKDPIRIILQDEPIPIQERMPELPESLAQVVDRAVRKTKDERYQTAGEFKRALEDALAEARVSTRSATLTIFREAEQETTRLMPVYCALCGANVTAQANSDSRATELAGDCIYWCALCAYLQRPGEEVGEHGYLEIKCLGGGIGETWLAWHPQTGRVVTLRKLRFWRNAEVNLKQFCRDIQQLAQIAHPALTCILETCLSDRTAIAVSAYLPGDNLWTWAVEKASTLSVKPAVEKALHMLDGLIHLEHNGWIYNNLHPWNILLPAAIPTKPRLCTADISLAYLVDCRDFDPERDPTWQDYARLVFLPPEAITDFKHRSPSQDVYGIGMILYFMLSRKLSINFPLQAHRYGGTDLLLKIVKDEPIPIRQHIQQVPGELAAVVDRAVSKRAAQRYESLGELKSALEQVRASL